MAIEPDNGSPNIAHAQIMVTGGLRKSTLVTRAGDDRRRQSQYRPHPPTVAKMAVQATLAANPTLISGITCPCKAWSPRKIGAETKLCSHSMPSGLNPSL
jgi:hypothetical protein